MWAMPDPTTLLASTAAAIVAIGALGTAAFGLVDATKILSGGISRVGFGHIKKALTPFAAALDVANSDWKFTLMASWINGMDKDDQKAQAKSLIRLGMSSAIAPQLAAAGHVDAAQLTALMDKVDKGCALDANDANLFGRFNAAIDADLDAGFERADQYYRNACKFAAGVIAVILAVWAGALVNAEAPNPGPYWFHSPFGIALLVGVIAVPIAPVAKDIASSLQTAASAVQSLKS
jgi:hypothetical protein